jgi:6-phosphofructokinase 1
MIRKIGILTSGGDSPGMNACIRGLVLAANKEGIETTGFIRGYEGLIDGHSVALRPADVAHIIQLGGTILKTARCERFKTAEGIAQAVKTLGTNRIDALAVIGGDGSFRGAIELSAKTGIPILGCAGTIDNDLIGTDFTIGYDTAINTAVQAIDKIRDTAESHDRIFVVEVMGRDAGLIALRTAIATGAEALLVPEVRNDMAGLVQKLLTWNNSRTSRIIVVAEGDQSGGALKVAEVVKQHCPETDVRVSILGHIQRGGSPTCMERVNASMIGVHMIKAFLSGRKNEMVGIIQGTISYTPLEKAVKHHQAFKKDLEELVNLAGS